MEKNILKQNIFFNLFCKRNKIIRIKFNNYHNIIFFKF